MTTPRIHRFDFNSLRDFRGPIVMRTAEDPTLTPLEPVAPPAPVFTEADIEAARLAGRKQGYGEGFAAGLAEAKSLADVKVESANTALAEFAQTMSLLHTRYTQLLKEESAYLSQLATAIARKVAAEAMDERGEQAILAIVERALPIIFSKPKLSIELNPELFDHTIGRIEEQLRQCGFEGEVQFKGNPDFALTDVTLDWVTGQMQRSTTSLWEEVEALIARVPLEITFNETLQTHDNPTGETNG